MECSASRCSIRDFSAPHSVSQRVYNEHVIVCRGPIPLSFHVSSNVPKCAACHILTERRRHMLCIQMGKPNMSHSLDAPSQPSPSYGLDFQQWDVSASFQTWTKWVHVAHLLLHLLSLTHHDASGLSGCCVQLVRFRCWALCCQTASNISVGGGTVVFSSVAVQSIMPRCIL